MTTTVKIKVSNTHQGKRARLRAITPASKDPAVPLTEGHVWEDTILPFDEEVEKYVHDGQRLIIDEVDDVAGAVQADAGSTPG